MIIPGFVLGFEGGDIFQPQHNRMARAGNQINLTLDNCSLKAWMQQDKHAFFCFFVREKTAVKRAARHKRERRRSRGQDEKSRQENKKSDR